MAKKILKGRVLKKRENTISIIVEKHVLHPKYNKTFKRTKKYAAHDPENLAVVGSIVEVEECAPISKTKTWILKNILKGGVQ